MHIRYSCYNYNTENRALIRPPKYSLIKMKKKRTKFDYSTWCDCESFFCRCKTFNCTKNAPAPIPLITNNK